MSRILALVTCSMLATSCATTGGAPAAQADSGVIVVSCPVGDASLWLDDRFVGEVAEARAGIRMRTGAHRLEVRHDGHLTRYFELEVARGERRTLACDLRENLSSN